MPDEGITRVSSDIDGEGEDGSEDGGQTGGGDDRPDWLPDKFESPEEMAKSYNELESKVGETGSDDGGEDAAGEDLDADDLKIQEETEGTDFDLNEVTKEYLSEGEISEETYEEFEEATGLDRSNLESHMRGQEALAQQAVNRMAEVAGGRENLGTVLDWAGQNLPDEQVQSYNRALEDGRMGDAELAMRGIVQQYVEARGVEGEFVSGGGTEGGSGGVEPFKSSDEVTEAMSDDRYNSDPAYRRQVQERLAESDLF